jgi:hypothetical protein
MQHDAVAVSIQTSDFALLVVAAREGTDRRIVPMIWVNANAPLFLECSRARIWRQAGQVHLLKNADLLAAQRKAQLAGAVREAMEDVSQQFNVLAYVQNPNMATELICKTKNLFDAPAEVSIANEPAYNWLLQKSEEANRAHRVLMYLANGDSGGIPAITAKTPQERAQLEENFLLHGDKPGWETK